MAVFKFDKSELEKALQFIKISVNDKNPDMAQYSFMHITFRIKEDKCQALLRSFDGITSCDLLFEPLIETDQLTDDQTIWESVVKMNKLYHIVSNSKKKLIKIKLENDKFKVIAEGVSTLDTLNKDDWFLPPSDKIEPYIDDFPIDQLVEAWDSTNFTITKDITKYDMSGILYDGNWVTTDGRCISIYVPENKKQTKETDEPREQLFMSPRIESLVKIIKKKLGITKIEVRVRKKSLVVFIIHSDIGKLRYMLALNSANFPMYKDVAKRYIEESKNILILERRGLLDTLNRVSIFLGINRKLQLILENDKLKLIASSGDTAAESYEYVDITESDNPNKVSLNVNIKYDVLYDIISSNNDECIKIRYKENVTQLVLQLENKFYIISTLIKA